MGTGGRGWPAVGGGHRVRELTEILKYDLRVFSIPGTLAAMRLSTHLDSDNLSCFRTRSKQKTVSCDFQKLLKLFSETTVAQS